ncbi:hypothetical protein IEO70_04990 [Bacillus sp. AGMB 02131]|uniref:Membrane protein YkvI n=1 Tax=Peribacillus faecalis TaxID=2772559 RepID=A0A927CUI0_9BACI|nr:hypothetical protein [Peribacillus faecalis]MBD3107716.1 hypothetical protein [Peribacillus faecalis]
MKNSINLAGAFVGIIVGAGFGSGQEVMQFFTNFGIYSVPAVFIAAICFSFIGMQIAQLGSHIQSTSHKDIIQLICGRYIGTAVDFILSFFLFGVAVIMIAGAGSVVEQQFGIPSQIGAIAMTVLTVATLLLKIDKIISIISSVTPFLLVIMIVIAGYAIFNADTSLIEIEYYSNVEEAAASHWILSSLLYVSFNIAVGFSMLSLMGGRLKNKKEAATGGIIGGVLLGVLLMLINGGMLTNMKNVQGIDMPTLYLANNITPILGHILSIILLAMIYNTCVGMLYAFTARFVPADTKTFKVSVVAVGAAAFTSSFVGFSKLVGSVYPIMGYVGFVLLGAVFLSWVRSLHHTTTLIPENLQ